MIQQQIPASILTSSMLDREIRWSCTENQLHNQSSDREQ